MHGAGTSARLCGLKEVRVQRLIVFADYVCPFCYLAQSALAGLEDACRVDIDVAAFELRPPGTPLPRLDSAAARSAWHESVVPLAAALGVPIEFPRRVTRTRKAHEAVAWARQHGAARTLHGIIYDAYWRDGEDIGRIDVLMDLAVSAGLDGTALKVALDIDQCTGQVERDATRAAGLGIGGVPAYVRMDGDEVTDIRAGVQTHDQLRDWVTDHHDV